MNDIKKSKSFHSKIMHQSQNDVKEFNIDM